MNNLEKWFEQHIENLKYLRSTHDYQLNGYYLVPPQNQMMDACSKYALVYEASHFISKMMNKEVCVFQQTDEKGNNDFQCITCEDNRFLETQLLAFPTENWIFQRYTLTNERKLTSYRPHHKQLLKQMEYHFLSWLLQQPNYRLLAVTGSLKIKDHTLDHFI